MISSNGLEELREISKALTGYNAVWTSIDPGAVAQLASLYEERCESWQKLIAAQSAALMLIQAVSEEGEVLRDDVIQKAEAQCVKMSEGTQIVEPAMDDSIEDLMNQTREIIEEYPQLWLEIKEQKNALLSRVDQLIESRLSDVQNNGDEPDWKNVCDFLRSEKDALLQEIKESCQRLADMEEKEAQPLLQEMHETNVSIRDVKNEKNIVRGEEKHIEDMLEDYHGIIVPQIQCDDMRDFLVDEEDALTEYYEAKIKRDSRIFDFSLDRSTPDRVEVTIVPKPDWMPFWAKPNQPSLKHVKILYTPTSHLPTDISVKVNTASVPMDAFDQIMTPFVRKIQDWKQDMLASPHFDLHGLVRLFF